MESNPANPQQQPLCHTHKSNCRNNGRDDRDNDSQERPLVYTCKVRLKPKKPRTTE